VGWREVLGIAPRGALHTAYPLSENSPELRALLAGWIGTSNGLPTPGEDDAFSIPAFSRGTQIVAGTIAGLPLRTYQRTDEQREQVPGIFDDPSGPFGLSPFEWVEMSILHLLCYRELYLQRLTNDGGAVIGYWPIHPGAVTKVEWVGTSKRFTVHYSDGDRILGTIADPTEAGAILQVLGPGITNGLRGNPLWDQHRATFQTAIAAEKAAARVFTGALVRGLVTTAEGEELDPDDPEGEAKQIMEKLNTRMNGVDHAGQFAFVNRHLKFDKWSQSNLDAQFTETRTFGIEDFARMIGTPPHLLAAIDKQTSWGTGVAEQNLGLARYCLMQYTSRLESAVNKALMPPGEFIEFDYKGLLQGSPKEEIELLIAEVGGPILLANEARRVLNLPPLPNLSPLEAPNGEEQEQGQAAS
jgi:HK97 family phage portal protein